MRPTITFLEPDLIAKIIAEALEILCKLGVEINNDGILKMLSDHGAKIDMNKNHVLLTNDIIDKALSTMPKSFKLYDQDGNEVTVTSPTASRFIGIYTAFTYVPTHLKVRSGTSGTPVAQASARTLTLVYTAV